MAANTAHAMSIFADSNAKSPAGYPVEEQHRMNHAHARYLGGKARTVKGHVLGYRFPDGSAVTADNFVEFLGDFASEDNAAKSQTPRTDSQLQAAGRKAQELAHATLNRELPFLGVFGAAARSGFTDDATAKVCGYAYLHLIESNTASVSVENETGLLDPACIKGDDAARWAASLEPQQ